jgi:hypothetical protein
LESENVSNSENVTQPKRSIKPIALAVIIAVSVIIGALLAVAFISSLQPQGQDAWLFKGAYATYEGSASISAEDLGGIFDMSMSIDFTVRQEIVDFNHTHALVSTSFQMSSSFGAFGGTTVEDGESAWVPLLEMGLMSAFEDVDLTDSYESTVNIDGFGTRTCVVYEYEIADDDLTMIVYVDKTLDWPLKMSMKMMNTDITGGEIGVDINLVETNIAALK